MGKALGMSSDLRLRQSGCRDLNPGPFGPPEYRSGCAELFAVRVSAGQMQYAARARARLGPEFSRVPRNRAVIALSRGLGLLGRNVVVRLPGLDRLPRRRDPVYPGVRISDDRFRLSVRIVAPGV
jgi:hypothetical protein